MIDKTWPFYEVTFSLDVTDCDIDRINDGAIAKYTNSHGNSEVRLPFVPFVGLHLGISQLVTVRQVHWLRQNHFEAECQVIECVDLSVVMYNRMYLKQCRTDEERSSGKLSARRFDDLNAAKTRIAELTGLTIIWSEEDK